MRTLFDMLKSLQTSFTLMNVFIL